MTSRRSNRWLAGGLVALAAGLAANTLLGPLVAGVITYPLSDPVTNQTLGLETVSLLVVAPLSALAAVLVLRGNRAGPIAAIPPAGYAAYMFVQYIIGPQYVEYPPVIPFHLAMFVLSGILLVLSWNRVRVEDLPTVSSRRRRIYSAVLVLLALFASFGYLFAVPRMLTGGTIPAEYIDDPSVYWTVFLLDLGVVVPITVAVSTSLLRGAVWARKALFGLVGWYALVTIAVLALFVSMLVHDDPNVTVGIVIALCIATFLIVAFTGWVYRPFLSQTSPSS